MIADRPLPPRVVEINFASDDASLDVLITAKLSDGTEAKMIFGPEQSSALIGRLLFTGQKQYKALGSNATKGAPSAAIPVPVDHLDAEKGNTEGEAVLWLTVGPQKLAMTVDVNSLVGLCQWLMVLLGGKPPASETPVH